LNIEMLFLLVSPAEGAATIITSLLAERLLLPALAARLPGAATCSVARQLFAALCTYFRVFRAGLAGNIGATSSADLRSSARGQLDRRE
jgi:hypothetical protein